MGTSNRGRHQGSRQEGLTNKSNFQSFKLSKFQRRKSQTKQFQIKKFQFSKFGFSKFRFIKTKRLSPFLPYQCYGCPYWEVCDSFPVGVTVPPSGASVPSTDAAPMFEMSIFASWGEPMGGIGSRQNALTQKFQNEKFQNEKFQISKTSVFKMWICIKKSIDPIPVLPMFRVPLLGQTDH